MAVSKKQMDYWRAQLAKGCPEIGNDAAVRFKAIRASSVVTSDNGMGLRLLSDDGDVAEVFLNPVVARQVMRQIVSAGETGDWFDESLNVKILPA